VLTHSSIPDSGKSGKGGTGGARSFGLVPLVPVSFRKSFPRVMMELVRLTCFVAGGLGAAPSLSPVL
jgi:hypothetical protein